ncbi:MAG: hypothetical protein GTN64_08660, partial [Candidatus Latescibacteria bacterium]|nr:hypothetical protein [Candidatus Latescibacterota bacterium]NIO78670.1 hypothetical protein [Candidatus Latescibacterota bacterium]
MGSKGVVSTNDAFSIPAEWIDEDFVMPTDLKERGGPGSGHHGHKGRPG